MRLIYFVSISLCSLILSCNDSPKVSEETTTSESSSKTIAGGILKTPPIDTIFGPGDRIPPPNIKASDTISKIDLEKFREALSGIYLTPIATIVDNDDQIAFSAISWAWGNTGPCTRFILCATYIGNFEITFSDGSIGFNKIIQRLTTSAHDCIANAKKALLGPKGDGRNPDRGLAVGWVMASQIHNRPVYDWLRNHGDAVIRALGQIH